MYQGFSPFYAGKCGVCNNPLICPCFTLGPVSFFCESCGETYNPGQSTINKFDTFVRTFPIAALNGITNIQILECLRELIADFEHSIIAGNSAGQLKCLSQISNICRQYAVKDSLIQELLNSILEVPL